MKILALDLGKFKTVSCTYGHGEPRFNTVATGRQEFAELLRAEQPEVVVFETCTAAGWVADLCEELGYGCLVANPNGEAWRWSTIKRKTDRDDALKLARMTASHELPTVHVPSRSVRARRSLLKFRQSIVSHRVSVQNEIRALWQAQGPLVSTHLLRFDTRGRMDSLLREWMCGCRSGICSWWNRT